MASDIFDEYAKLAIERGIIKVAQAPKESKELKKFKNDSYPRAGSDTIEIIESKYNTKPDKPKSQQYKKNIMEVAHPNKVILNPAYDKINALIENNIERQKIMINITQKPVNGHLTQHKYAEAALAKSLISIANDLDNKNIEPLRKLADECIENLHRKADFMDNIENWIGKRYEDVTDIGSGAIGGAELGAVVGGIIGAFGGPAAALGGAWVGARGGALVGGLIAAISATAPQAKNVAINAAIAKDRLDTLRQDNNDDLFLSALDNALNSVIETATLYKDAVDQMQTQTTNPAIKQQAAVIATKYQTQIKQLDILIETFLRNIKAGNYMPQENEIVSKIESPFAAMFGTHVHKAEGAFSVLETVTKEALEGINATRREATGLATTVQTAPTPSATPVAGSPASGTEQEPTRGSPEWIEWVTKKMQGIQNK